MKEKNKKARNKFISAYIRFIAVTGCAGAAAAGMLSAWARMRCMMTGVLPDTVDSSVLEAIRGTVTKLFSLL